MTKIAIGICILLIASCSGCSPDNTPSSSDKQIEAQLRPAQATHTKVQLEPVTDVPNNGLQLPLVSPDGKWIAYLDLHSDRAAEFDALFTGHGLAPMSLHIRSLAPGGIARKICASGSAWPAWSPDSRKLVFVAYDAAGKCRLGIYDLPAGTTRFLSISSKSLVMPAVSPNGRQVALVAPGDQVGSLRLHVRDLATGKLTYTCPTDLDGPKQLWPQWTRDGQIIFVLIHDQQSWLAQWLPGDSWPRRLCELRMPESQLGMFQSLAGLPKPLSPDDARFAYYNTAADRIILLNLRDDRQEQLPMGIRAGCWLDAQRFAAADDEELRLFSIPSSAPALLMHGRWLPRHGSTDGLILCTPGRHRGLFSLVRMRVFIGQ